MLQTQLPLAVGLAAKASDRAPAAHGQHTIQRGLLVSHQQVPLAWHGTHQMVELAFDGGQVGKDIGVVEFEVVHHGDRRAVVHELGALVEKGRIVLVRLDHERCCCAS